MVHRLVRNAAREIQSLQDQPRLVRGAESAAKSFVKGSCDVAGRKSISLGLNPTILTTSGIFFASSNQGTSNLKEKINWGSIRQIALFCVPGLMSW